MMAKACALAFYLLGLGLLAVAAELPVEDNARSRPLFEWSGFLEHAHSHNDYEQARPLHDALASGITSLEADLWLEGDTIMVGHSLKTLRGSLEALYLEPLHEAWMHNRLPTGTAGRFLLWLDLKDPNPQLRKKLHGLLSRFPMFSARQARRADCRVILTGHEQSKHEYVRAFPSDNFSRDSNLFTITDPPATPQWEWYALDWKKIGAWDGHGAMPPVERAHLRELVESIRQKGRKVRLWNNPATLSFWREAAAAGVDLIGTDVLPRPSTPADDRRKQP